MTSATFRLTTPYRRLGFSYKVIRLFTVIEHLWKQPEKRLINGALELRHLVGSGPSTNNNVVLLLNNWQFK